MEQNIFTLKDKVIVITGGTGILGNAFINGIVDAGGKVAILGRKKDVADERAAAVNSKGGHALGVVADVLDEQQLLRAKEEILSEFGKIDGLVNGAGGNMPGGVLQPSE